MPAETLEFKAELKQLLHLITHSLYSDREIFLRELISNASDAINKVKFDSLENDDRLEGNKDWKIKIIPDAVAKTLTVSDNGIGMGREQVIDLLGTVAKSGTKAFVEAVKAKNDPNSPGLIGQFGVGFYSAFMVADAVTVHTRPAGAPADGIRWTSDGQGEYTLEQAEKASRGTDVILHLKEDAQEFLNPYKLRSLVKKFSDFIEHPVVMDTEEEGEGDDKKKVMVEETLNNRKAIWLRTPREVKEEEYAEFYKVLSNDDTPPAKTLHFTIEGKSEFKALLFIPAKKPFSFDWDEPKAGLRLYVQRVLIMDRCEELLPLYLRFVKGVVDSADLPLNVSREILQQNPHLDTIRKNVVRNVLQGLDGLKNTQPEKYRAFYDDLGPILKEGLSRDCENKERIADLLLFASVNTEAGKVKTLAEYAEAMPAGQEEIFYLAGDNAAQLRNSPYLEAYRAKGYDVLLLTDPVDEFAVPALREYKGKKLQAADKGELKSEGDGIPEDAKAKFAPLFESLKKVLPEVGDIRLTKRLTTSAACLVADAGAMTAHMERLMQRFGEDATGAKRVLELNPDNQAVEALRTLHEKSADDPRIAAYGLLLYDQAAIAEGSKVPDPAGFAKRINDLILTDLK